MAGLQRSAVSFRRQGSSGTIWDDKFLAGLINQQKKEQEEEKKRNNNNTINTSNNNGDEIEIQLGGQQQEIIKSDAGPPAPLTIERTRSTGRAHRTGRVSPAMEPPSPKVSACGLCGAFGKGKSNKTRHRPPKSGKRVM